MYKWIAIKQAVEAFIHFPEDQREALLREFNQLASNPFEQADSILPGESDAPFCEVKLSGGLVVSYYVDHAAKEVRILSIDES